MPKQDHPPISSLTTLTIASRGSQLALWQARYVQNLLAERGLTALVDVIKTTGDRVQDRFLHEIGGKGLFVRELELALLQGQADLAVHSLKDLPAVTKEPYELAAVLPRHQSGDVMVLHPAAAKRLGAHDGMRLGAAELKAWSGLHIGTGSLRRKSLLEEANPSLRVTPIRGNVDTRLRKLRAGEWDAIVLAAASLERLDIAQDLVKAQFAADWFVPSSSQGALVIETLQSHPLAKWLHDNLGCPATTFCVSLERAVLAALGGDCTLPIGVHAELLTSAAGQRVLQCRAVMLASPRLTARAFIEAPLGEARGFTQESLQALCHSVVEQLLADGGNSVLQALKLAPITL